VIRKKSNQLIYFPKEVEFPTEVKTVNVRVIGKDRIISPTNNSWDSFFLTDERVSDDFMS